MMSLLVSSACARPTPQSSLLPTRVVPTVDAAALTAQAGDRQNGTDTNRQSALAPTATSPAFAATPRPVPANAITKSSLADLKQTYRREEPPVRHIISAAADRILALQSRSFAVYSATDLKLIGVTTYTLSSNEGTYWYAGSSDTRRGAIMQADGSLRVFDLESGKQVTSFSVGAITNPLKSDIALSRDGSELLLVAGQISRIDAKSGAKIAIVGVLPENTIRIQLAEDASRLAALTDDNTIVVLNVSKQPSVTFSVPFTSVNPPTLQMAPDGSWMSVASDADLAIWNLSAPASQKPVIVEEAAGSEVVFDGRTLAALTDPQGLVLYDLTTRKPIRVQEMDRGAQPLTAHFAADGRSIFAATITGLSKFDTSTGNLVASTNRIATDRLALSPNGGLAVARSQLAQFAGLDLVDTHNGEIKGRLKTVAPPVATIFSAAGTYLAVFSRGRVLQVFRIADFKLVQQIELARAGTSALLCFSNDEGEFSYIENDQVLSVNLESGARRSVTLAGKPDRLGGCDSQDRTLFIDSKGMSVVSRRGEVVAELPLVAPLKGDDVALLSPDGRYVVSTQAGEAQVWDVSTSKRLFGIRTSGRPYASEWHPLARRLALIETSENGSLVDLVDPANGGLSSIAVADGFVTRALFTADPDVVAVVSYYRDPRKTTPPQSLLDYQQTRISFYAISSGNLLRSLNFDSVQTGVDLSTDGTTLATGGPDGVLTIWSISK